MFKLLSNGDMYDTRRGLYMCVDKDKPSPQNKQQTDLTRLRVQKLVDLQDHELDYLVNESRRLIRLPLKSLEYEPWYRQNNHQRHREYFIHQLQHDYYWEVCSKIQYKYTKEQLDKMPWTESRHKKHEHVLGPTMWEWVERHRPNQYHALWGKRKTLPGVARSLETCYNRKITNKQSIKNVTSTKRTRIQRVSRTRVVAQTEPARRNIQISRLHEHRQDRNRRRLSSQLNRA